MTALYDARGNIYLVTSPSALRTLGIDIPQDAALAAATRTDWTTQAVSALCQWPQGEKPEHAKAHRCDGLLVGPFQEAGPFDLLIVNTDGTLAERSGNGLTIFSQALTDSGRIDSTSPFVLKVHHDHVSSLSPVATTVTPDTLQTLHGFWLDLGKPAFGPHAVQATASGLIAKADDDVRFSSVKPLIALDPRWCQSIFVRIGNPHCVTLVSEAEALPGFRQLHEQPLNAALTRIAFAKGDHGNGEPCASGVNLQWAAVSASNTLIARVFERGEGPTASSGTSASAVAAAAWLAGRVSSGSVDVVMPGGTAPVRLIEQAGDLVQVLLFGTAYRSDKDC
ncbi:diaminopimelate epimerase [Pseudomonas sp. BJa5]|uniref:diaminopimelate epimerase n=1 Tax=Pseudomonas sp. BJa5 TaxID=2936270 RepID=UPI002559D6E4|nr:diaminopimelate epimerase [Pseudomonas sp. BGr12]MDL2419750.1 diaminopimelate epimerase [Pseudomonas sp. BGr12]